MQHFAVGQRWFCESESQLGLGIVTALLGRQVRLYFPQVGEERLYSVQNAPLQRLTFAVDDTIESAEGWQLKVERCTAIDGILLYAGARLDTGQYVELPESQIAHRLTFSNVKVRLFSGQFDRHQCFDLRLQALRAQHAQFQSPWRGLRGARAALIPHQLHIAKQVGERTAPRVLLADEVGLGKTIEAGLIIQHQLLSEKIQRVLIVVPDHLQYQWLVEMRRRFDLPFSLLGNDDAANPFRQNALLICSLTWLLNSPERTELAQQAEIDMLVMDEAHHLAWSLEQASEEYCAIETLAQAIPSVLLLSATPEQLGLESHFARLRLLDPHRFYDFNAFQNEQDGYQRVVQIINKLLDEQPLSVSECKLIGELLYQPHFSVTENNRQATIDALLDRHGTSRVLFRNTRLSIKGFPKREVRLIELPLPVQYEHVAHTLAPQWHYAQQDNTTPWWQFDPRISEIVACLQQDNAQKWVLLCHYADTAIAIEQALRTRLGIRCALFHEQMSLLERDRAAAYFAEQEQGARLLICSAIGAEGRNFQFASGLMLFDIPDHPDRLEQAIGRLDRIGQGAQIEIIVPYFSHSAQARLVQWYHHGLNAFAQTCPMGETLFAEWQELITVADDVQFQTVIAQTQARKAQLAACLAQGRDKLLEYHSNGGQRAVALANGIAKDDENPALADFAQRLFECVGIDCESLSDTHFLLRAGENMLSDFITLPDEGISATFDRTFALAREEVQFLTWDSRFIRQGIDFVLASDLGKSAVALLINPALPVGTSFVELVFVLHTQAPNALQLTRFLPPTPIRLLLDRQGRDLSVHVASHTLQAQLKNVPKGMGQQMIAMTKSIVEHAIAHAQPLVKQQSAVMIAHATETMHTQMQAEITRLKALAAVNGAIRQTEIESLITAERDMAHFLANASVRLDSVRLIVSNKE
ncbi:RNA polymerase-associated protein RapA [Spirabiliibacterium falconis]|uniref:RNA polymerase-associated protein RapA n=1 Tax=Spirabiliibacterium falconis TaxID=572023 RepID=UPI001AAC784D|nr:RNA polymerase-associated protein RapA [Spirabiliibacterium falconis]MBE2893605.1 RNA polymerase-associated protein RapA [Spirabiliibacterium falconis]